VNKLEEILGISFPPGIEISSATNSTQKIRKNSIFFALPGSQNHGSVYIEKALELGASIAVHNDSSYRSDQNNIFYIQDLQEQEDATKNTKVYYFLKAFFKIDPSKFLIHTFTGTNGKTSTAHLCHQLILNAGDNSLYIGTLGAQYNNEEVNTSLCNKTTPDIFEFYEILKNYDLKSANICIEISSHALDQKRLFDLTSVDSASLLNIGRDHLDYHSNIEEYAQTKFKIFNNISSLRLINEDLISTKDHYPQIYSVSNKNKLSDIYYEIIESSIKITTFSITINNASLVYLSDNSLKSCKYNFSCSLFPEFNINNLVFAISVIGFNNFLEDDFNDVSFLKLPKGRTELIPNIDSNIIIDYAHNPDGFKFLLSSINNYFNNLIIVFGCGGDRDKLKRPEMLSIAIEYGVKIIFTSDNSRSEAFENIFADASIGNIIKDVILIEDRREAIIHGNRLMGDNDCMVILGKGHEETQDIGGKISYFSDHEVVNEIYK